MPVGGLPLVAKRLRNLGLDKETIGLVMDAWRPSTKKVYAMYIRKWATFCTVNNVPVFAPQLKHVCTFLKKRSLKGLGYGALNAARSALATFLPPFDNYQMGKHPIICWLFKGAYERNPPKVKYKKFWDVNKVFTLIKSWGKNSGLTLKLLSLKVAVLILLVTSQRGQTVLSLLVKNMEVEDDIVCRLDKLLKHNRLGDELDTLILKPFRPCSRLCVVKAMKAYLKRTESLRKQEKQLLVSYLAPHAAISRDTLSHWTLSVLAMADIDVAKYKGHLTRGASASAARRIGAPLNLIMRQARWRSVESFARFYNKPLDQEPETVGHLLLNQAI